MSKSLLLRLTESEQIELLALVETFEKSPGFSWSSDKIQQELSHSQAWGLFSEGILKAFVLWREGLDAFEIMALGTHPLARRQGFMKSLLVALIASCQKDILLEVHEFNESAIKLYQDVGFQRSGLRKNYYSDGASAVLMSFLRKDF